MSLGTKTAAGYLLEHLPDDTVRHFSPDLYRLLQACPKLNTAAGISRNVVGNRSLNLSSELARPDLFAVAAIEQCSLDFRQAAWAWEGGWNELEMYEGVWHYGSLVAYSLASSGNAEALNMLPLIAGLPSLIPGSTIGAMLDPAAGWYRVSTRGRSEFMATLCCLTAGDPDNYTKTLGETPNGALYSRLLGVDREGRCSFARANALTDEAIRECVQTIFHDALHIRHRIKAEPLSPFIWYNETGPAMTALAVTQSHVFLEQGTDPAQVFALAQRRLRAFLSFMKVGDHVDQIARVGASGAFLVAKWRKAAPFIQDDDLAGIDYNCAKTLDENKRLDILKAAPGLLAGPLSFFDQSEDQVRQKNVFNFFKTRQRLETISPLHAFGDKTLHRTAAYCLGKRLLRADILGYPGAAQALRDYHAQPPSKLHWVHPLVSFRMGWLDWADANTFLRFFHAMLSDKLHEEQLALEGLRTFSRCYPEHYDNAYKDLVKGDVAKRFLERAAVHITPSMSSFASLGEQHWDRGLAIDLGL
ncbi:hypothetical protein [Pseudomonas sp. Leaf58]|uniref:hypothetical protein n=1 Tax=Pseudomonas sp. Leaf58 TaxID=1736226 RepID=UPI0006F8BAB4|nr:hypothetical protein [Pseudomonas sp. Leaf58]KQN62391.1 hypothetical protein ASF02_09585 [Pseudomonas sp. Leaf58]